VSLSPEERLALALSLALGFTEAALATDQECPACAGSGGGYAPLHCRACDGSGYVVQRVRERDDDRPRYGQVHSLN
jgi:RecJ-like exonuclease